MGSATEEAVMWWGLRLGGRGSLISLRLRPAGEDGKKKEKIFWGRARGLRPEQACGIRSHNNGGDNPGGSVEDILVENGAGQAGQLQASVLIKRAAAAIDSQSKRP